ncbi:MAG: VacJ like lipoprotein [Rhodobacterales bacterium]|nr:MAG: VacJ like lipoprotein [Rhodobacterales bacterium]
MTKLGRIKPLLMGMLVVMTGVAGCARPPQPQGINDPYEAANRRMHATNKQIDASFSSAGGGGMSIPDEIAIPVSNFADNVSLPGKVLNNLLQADIGGAGMNTMRFIVNTTVGIGGLLDPADAIGLTEVDTDFGETLYVWGVPEGAYLELPVLGPSTERDLAGRVVDFVIDPLSHVGTDPQIRYGRYAKIGDKVLTRQQFGDTVDEVLHQSADSYAQARLMYLQHRRWELSRGGVDSQAVDPYVDSTDAYAIDPYEEMSQ